MNDKRKTDSGCEEWFALSMSEVSYSFGVGTEIIQEIIDEGIVTLKKDKHNQWQFDSESIRCIRMVLRLKQDLGVNIAGAGLALDLMKKIEQLQKAVNNQG
ncbi:chaperone modulator CbpM [Legionella israelensis]|uniref:Putative chaperone-modulator protein CbpM n=1 Tax=Legionella israelensis TaxID=454 RepID=A0A0W0V4M1_9GAMM|nr:chaperone modulator CbpM [Legionella israelensis]KTD15043.1 putative chaperone-modulator protein CbpM [Legionella israelensis]QBS10205.1 MerR family transcriptional regulator [Legionella israelensis]SCY20371.1 chaperone modulatory protein CbpM [Legionella israelensis DSM 19235]STX59798.1 putative chaperone-modulator protein CbpM [Legionella israelensis]